MVPVRRHHRHLKYRLYDIDRIIRTLVYGLLTALLAGVYAGVVLVLGQVVGGVSADPPSWVVAGATLAVAALFQRACRRIQALADRRFNRRKYGFGRRQRLRRVINDPLHAMQFPAPPTPGRGPSPVTVGESSR